MRIPKTFKIFGQTYNVIPRTDLVYTDDHNGEMRMRSNTILLQVNSDGYSRTLEQIEQVYLHELIHAAFDALDYVKFRDNEEIVNRLANVLHQVFKTQEGELLPDSLGFSPERKAAKVSRKRHDGV